jgi:hypothetical protein
MTDSLKQKVKERTVLFLLKHPVHSQKYEDMPHPLKQEAFYLM